MWDQRFAATEYIFGTEPNLWLRDHAAAWQAGQRVLCVADGEGRNSVWLAKQGLMVDAFDISPVGIAKARTLAASQGVAVTYSVHDCEDFAWPQTTYDGVAMIFLQFADPIARARLFANIRNCLKSGGILILQGYTPKQLEYKTGGPPHLSHMYTESLLRQELTGFDIQIIQEYEADLNEGSKHVGRSALLGLVARCI